MGVWKKPNEKNKTWEYGKQNLMIRIKHGSMEKPNEKNKTWEYGKT